MTRNLYKSAFLIFLAAAFFAAGARAQMPGAPVRDAVKPGVRNLSKVPVPNLKLLSVNEKSETVNGKTVNLFTFGIVNWKSFPDELFAAAPDLPACGANKTASRTWLTIYDFQTGAAFNSNCGFVKSENLKTFAFNIDGANLPDCVYVTLTDRESEKIYKSNPVKTNRRAGKCEAIKP